MDLLDVSEYDRQIMQLFTPVVFSESFEDIIGIDYNVEYRDMMGIKSKLHAIFMETRVIFGQICDQND